jgi:uncharacterized membrane protein
MQTTLPVPPVQDLNVQEALLLQLNEHAQKTRRYSGICALVLGVFGVLYALVIVVVIVTTAANA